MYTFWLKKVYLKLSAGKWRPFFLGLDVLSRYYYFNHGELLDGTHHDQLCICIWQLQLFYVQQMWCYALVFLMDIYFALIDPSSTKWLPFWQTTFSSAFSCIRCVDGCVAACTSIIMSCRSVSILVQNCHKSNMSTIYAIQINTDAAVHQAVINGIAKTHNVSIHKVPHLTYQLHCHGELDAQRRDHGNYICASE